MALSCKAFGRAVLVAGLAVSTSACGTNPHNIGETVAVVGAGAAFLGARVLGADNNLAGLAALGAGAVGYAIVETFEPRCVDLPGTIQRQTVIVNGVAYERQEGTAGKFCKAAAAAEEEAIKTIESGVGAYESAPKRDENYTTVRGTPEQIGRTTRRPNVSNFRWNK